MIYFSVSLLCYIFLSPPTHRIHGIHREVPYLEIVFQEMDLVCLLHHLRGVMKGSGVAKMTYSSLQIVNGFLLLFKLLCLFSELFLETQGAVMLMRTGDCKRIPPSRSQFSYLAQVRDSPLPPRNGLCS
jgi:hypothetical protein